MATHAHEEVHCRAVWQQHLEHVADVSNLSNVVKSPRPTLRLSQLPRLVEPLKQDWTHELRWRKIPEHISSSFCFYLPFNVHRIFCVSILFLAQYRDAVFHQLMTFWPMPDYSCLPAKWGILIKLVRCLQHSRTYGLSFCRELSSSLKTLHQNTR